MNKKNLILLFAVLLIGAILRLWQLGNVPISPDWDEVALGYNAYSIIHTGRDEYGQLLPIVMRSFDDYKPALYSYLSIPTILLFGVNVVAVRLPSVIFGILTLIAVYFLLKEIFSEKNLKVEVKGFVLDIPILSTLLLAISPWHIQFSRIAFESNVGLAFNVFTALFFIKGLKSSWYLSLSAISAALGIYVYQSEKVFTPLFVFALAVIFRKELLLKPKKYILVAIAVGLILILPMLSYTLGNKNALERARGVSIFSDSTQFLSENTKRLLTDREKNDVIGLIVDNRRVLFAREVIAGYISHFELNWLFVRGDISRHHAPNMGLMYLFELPFLLMGIYMLIFGPFSRKSKIFIFAWFLLVPIPASITSGVPHSVRTLNFLPTFQIFTAIGILTFLLFIEKLKHKIIEIVILLTFIFSVIFNFIYYLNQYFVQQNYFTAFDWQYGYEKTIAKLNPIAADYKKIVVSNQPPMDQSYMFFLFYLKYPPHLYQRESMNASGGFRENHKFDKYDFRPINWQEDSKMQNTLFIGRPSDFPNSYPYIFKIDYPDSNTAIRIVKP